MSFHSIKQLPLTFRGGRKSDVRSQFAALCYKFQDEKLRVLMVTSRNTRRWIIPKGWPIDGMTPAQSALQEAWEEAGVIGKAEDICLGLYSYNKLLNENEGMPCLAMVYPVKVQSLSDEFREAGQRERKWVSRKKAAKLVAEPELARILRDFDPRKLS